MRYEPGKSVFWEIFGIVLAVLVFIILYNEIYIKTNLPAKNAVKLIKGRDSVVWVIDTIHDTIVKWVKPEAIRDTIIVFAHDTVKDTVRCWQFGEREPDGAMIDVSVCSDSLPRIPGDLRCRIGYIRPEFDSTKTIVRVDVREVTIESKRKQFIVGLVAGLAGIGAGCLITGFTRGK